MRRRYWQWMAAALVAVIGIQSAAAAPDPRAAFGRVWERYDRAVAGQQSGRSWTWGPAANTNVLDEEYFATELPTSRRMVQYFDKGRMELNNPAGNPDDPWYVTSGLLPVELMFNRMQTGTSQHVVPRSPATGTVMDSYVSAIGDPESFPAYPDLQPLYENPGTVQPSEIGRPVTEMFNPDLRISSFTGYANDPATFLVQGRNNHGVPRAFVDFQEQQGLVTVNGSLVKQQVYDPLFIFGLPVTPAVWVKTRIAGVERVVLFQVFERRLLTYNPANPPAFRVEMGNVGQHYYRWRYQPQETGEWAKWDWQTREVRSRRDPSVRYTLEIDWTEIPSGAPAGQGPPPRKTANFRIYYSANNGATRELRYSGKVGDCYTVDVALLPVRSPDAPTTRIGLATRCMDGPKGIAEIRSSYDGGRTFVNRFG